MRQGDGTVTTFTKAVLADRDLLHFLGVSESEDDVRNTIIAGLSSEEAQSFAFRFVDLPLSRFVAEVDRYETLTAYHTSLSAVRYQHRRLLLFSPRSIPTLSEMSNAIIVMDGDITDLRAQMVLYLRRSFRGASAPKLRNPPRIVMLVMVDLAVDQGVAVVRGEVVNAVVIVIRIGVAGLNPDTLYRLPQHPKVV